MRLLAVDIGNTATNFGLFESGTLMQHFDFLTRTLMHQGLVQEKLSELLSNIADIEVIVIASVVPWASDELITALHTLSSGSTIVLLTGADIPLECAYPNKDELGTDRLLGALAAYTMYARSRKSNAIVIDLGTATTFDAVDKDGVFRGGAIAPGIGLAASALANEAAQLSSVSLEFPPSVIGTTTTESMQSGILFGAIAQVEGMVARIRLELFGAEPVVVVATGGLSFLLDGRTDIVDHIEPKLILMGTEIAARMLEEQGHLYSVHEQIEEEKS